MSFVKQCITTREMDITHRFITQVRTAPVMQKRVTEYAKELQVSANYLSRIIRRNAGVSPISYVHRHFIMLAKNMALETPLSMKEIAYQLGFEDSAHFSKFFKVNTGHSFSTFRKTAVQALQNQ